MEDINRADTSSASKGFENIHSDGRRENEFSDMERSKGIDVQLTGASDDARENVVPHTPSKVMVTSTSSLQNQQNDDTEHCNLGAMPSVSATPMNDNSPWIIKPHVESELRKVQNWYNMVEDKENSSQASDDDIHEPQKSHAEDNNNVQASCSNEHKTQRESYEREAYETR